MKNTLLLFTILLGTYAVSAQTNVQVNSATEISLVKLSGETVEFTVESSKKFYVGGNIHILHIGNKSFGHSKNGKSGNKYTLTFLIPVSEFNSLINGSEIWMSYGNKISKKDLTEDEIKKMEKSNPNAFWYLGKFNKSMLK